MHQKTEHAAVNREIPAGLRNGGQLGLYLDNNHSLSTPKSYCWRWILNKFCFSWSTWISEVEKKGTIYWRSWQQTYTPQLAFNCTQHAQSNAAWLLSQAYHNLRKIKCDTKVQTGYTPKAVALVTRSSLSITPLSAEGSQLEPLSVFSEKYPPGTVFRCCHLPRSAFLSRWARFFSLRVLPEGAWRSTGGRSVRRHGTAGMCHTSSGSWHRHLLCMHPQLSSSQTLPLALHSHVPVASPVILFFLITGSLNSTVRSQLLNYSSM